MKKEKQKSKKTLGKILSAAIGGVIGGLAGFFGMSYLDKMGVGVIMGFVWMMAGLIIAIYLQIILHEAGHLICGLISGYKFVSFRIGSFIIYRRQGKIHFGRYTIAGTGGQCLMAPPDLIDGKMPYRLYNFGGAIMNLITAVIAVMVLSIGEVGIFANYFCAAFALMGALFAITNGVPMHLNEIDNDGYNALSLGKTPEALRGLWIQLKVNEMLTEGKRLRNMPESWFIRPAEAYLDNSMVAAVEALRCNRMLDAMELEQANEEIAFAAKHAKGMEGIQETLLRIDQVYCEICGERKEKILNRMQNKEFIQFMKTMKKFPSIIRTQYAYALLVEGDEKKAEKLKMQFKKAMKYHPYQGEAEGEWELIRHCEQNWRNQQSQSIENFTNL